MLVNTGPLVIVVNTAYTNRFNFPYAADGKTRVTLAQMNELQASIGSRACLKPDHAVVLVGWETHTDG